MRMRDGFSLTVFFALACACARPAASADQTPTTEVSQPVSEQGVAAELDQTPSIIKAMRLYGFGEPNVLVYEDAPLPPAPGPGELRVRVHAVGINPLDHKVRAGMVPRLVADRFPFILGWDLSGTVESVGPDVSAFAVGDPIFAMLALHRAGAYAEYTIVHVDEAAPKPASLSHEQAAAVPLAGLTAWQALVDTAALTAGQTVLIHGGSGGVGSFAIQIAKARGARVIATASAANQDLLRELGADLAIDYRATKFEDVAGAVDVVLDTVGGDTQARSIGIVKAGGIIVSIVAPPDPEALAARGIRGTRLIVHPDGAALVQLGALIDAKKLTPVVSQVFALAEAALAHTAIASGHTRGKIVLRVEPRGAH